jgi:peptidoglycan/LPS O-acetylase OafA/YrhL
VGDEHGNLRLGYVPALDGLRGIAIAIVVAYHASGWPKGGWLGVDLFFVLSGFLITTLLLDEHAATGTIRLRAFYARRARRLLPALGVLLLTYLAISAAHGVDALGLVARWGLYTGNVYEAFWPGAAQHLVGLNHLWSLAQEEQFYLAWPVALLAVRRTRNPALVLGLLVLALVAYRDILVLRGASDARIYFAPDTHLDGLLLGAALAFHRRRRAFDVSRLHLVAAAWTAFLIVALIPALGITEVAFLPVFEGAMVVLVAAAVTGALPVPRPLIWLGGISYSLYLWHFVVLWAFHWQHQLLAVALSVVAAYASTVWIERPFRSKREAHALRPVPIPAPTVS